MSASAPSDPCTQSSPPPRGGRRPSQQTIAVLIVLACAALLALSCRAPVQSQSGDQTAPPQVDVPTSTPAPPVARLQVESEPSGAAVAVNGQERGATPLMLNDLDVGSHLVKLSMPGRVDWQSDVSLSPDETRLLAVMLQEPTPAPTATPEPTGTPEPTATPEPTQGPIYPVAIMVENHPDARPQSGLASADVVYEALVEGGISRFMAIFINGESDVIGPVRSARHYFAYIAAEYNASYVFIGASPQGYAALTATRLVRLDETYGDPGFWRSRARYAPHNAYTSTDLVRSSLEQYRRVTPGSLAGLRFRDGTEPVQGPEAPELSLLYPWGYQVEYVYSPEENVYRRYMEGAPHRDAATGEQMSPRNVVVQYVKAWLIPGDDAGRLDMEQVGEGKALYFRDGVVTEGYWYRPSYGNHTEWYDSRWRPIELNPGKTWIQMVPLSATVSY